MHLSEVMNQPAVVCPERDADHAARLMGKDSASFGRWRGSRLVGVVTILTSACPAPRCALTATRSRSRWLDGWWPLT
jgi:hypothetical protein